MCHFLVSFALVANKRKTLSWKLFKCSISISLDKRKEWKKNLKKYLFECSFLYFTANKKKTVYCTSCLSVEVSEENFSISGTSFTPLLLPYPSSIISYVSLQWFTHITGAEGYPIPLRTNEPPFILIQPYDLEDEYDKKIKFFSFHSLSLYLYFSLLPAFIRKYCEINTNCGTRMQLDFFIFCSAEF